MTKIERITLGSELCGNSVRLQGTVVDWLTSRSYTVGDGSGIATIIIASDRKSGDLPSPGKKVRVSGLAECGYPPRVLEAGRTVD